MFVHRHLSLLPPFKNAVITTGTFDGVHIGHRKILGLLKAESERIGGETVVITFHPHPRKLFSTSGGDDIKLLTLLDEKIVLLSDIGIDHLVVVDFDGYFSNLSPNEYIESFLYARFMPKSIVLGYDHRFGKDRKGDYRALESFSDKFGYRLIEIEAEILQNATVSSTRIRQALTVGDMGLARSFLGYPFFLTGKVVQGNQLGRTIGFPTANLELQSTEKILPTDGVYAVKVWLLKLENETQTETGGWNGMMNIGIRPTIGGSKRFIEVHIIGFSGDIYGETLLVRVYSYLRSEVKFSGIDALRVQLGIDEENAIEALNNC